MGILAKVHEGDPVDFQQARLDSREAWNVRYELHLDEDVGECAVDLRQLAISCERQGNEHVVDLLFFDHVGNFFNCSHAWQLARLATSRFIDKPNGFKAGPTVLGDGLGNKLASSATANNQRSPMIQATTSEISQDQPKQTSSGRDSHRVQCKEERQGHPRLVEIATIESCRDNKDEQEPPPP